MKKKLTLAAAVLYFAATPSFAQLSNPLQQVENSIEGELHPSDAAIVQGRQQVREVARESLASLYEVAPAARRAIERSAGYAVFSTFGVKLFFAGGTSGKGMVVNNRTSRETFMRMLQVQGGLGFGIAQNRLIFVFTTQEALNNFINQGWEFGAQANVSAMAGGQGGMFTGAASIAPGVYLYQLTQNGLSATLTVAGTKFFRDPQL
jgi:lipid-binding SYLF domain-containing protein